MVSNDLVDNFIPWNAMDQCNRCRKVRKMFTCDVYPKWIPKEIVGHCPDFEAKERK